MPVRVAVVPVVVAVLASLGTACGGPAAPTSSTPSTREAPAVDLGLAAVLVQHRPDAVERRLAVTAHVAGPADVHVTSVAVESPLLAPEPPTPKDTELSAGGRAVALRVPYGRVRCDVDPATAGPPAALVAGRRADGTAGTARVVMADQRSVDLVRRLHATECAEEAVGAAVALTWSDAWTADGDALVADLLLRRRAGVGPVAVLEVGGGINFLVEPAAAPPDAAPVAVLPADAAVLRVPVRVRAGRCDEHALLESKERYHLPVRVQVGAAEPVLLEVVPPPSGRAALGGLLDACARAGAADG